MHMHSVHAAPCGERIGMVHTTQCLGYTLGYTAANPNPNPNPNPDPNPNPNGSSCGMPDMLG